MAGWVLPSAFRWDASRVGWMVEMRGVVLVDV